MEYYYSDSFSRINEGMQEQNTFSWDATRMDNDRINCLLRTVTVNEMLLSSFAIVIINLCSNI